MIRLHLIANALLLWLGYYWLGVGESSIPRLLWSALVAIALLSAALLVHGAAQVDAKPLDALRTAARNLLPLFILTLLAFAIYGLLEWWQTYSATPALNIASWLTLKTRKPWKPDSVLRVFNFFLWIVEWVIVPWLLVPLAAACARNGWKGFTRDTWKHPRLYWVVVPLLLVVALWLPLKLMGWHPAFSSFTVQVMSFAVRLLIAYALFVGGLLALARATAGKFPLLTARTEEPAR